MKMKEENWLLEGLKADEQLICATITIAGRQMRVIYSTTKLQRDKISAVIKQKMEAGEEINRAQIISQVLKETSQE
jgi:hypothetical protein